MRAHGCLEPTDKPANALETAPTCCVVTSVTRWQAQLLRTHRRQLPLECSDSAIASSLFAGPPIELAEAETDQRFALS